MCDLGTINSFFLLSGINEQQSRHTVGILVIVFVHQLTLMIWENLHSVKHTGRDRAETLAQNTEDCRSLKLSKAGRADNTNSSQCKY